MNIRSKILGINSLAVVCVLVLIYLISAPLILHGFEKVEDTDARQNVGRGTDALHGQLDALGGKVRDWSSWDDSYNFVNDKNPEFIQSNFGGSPRYESPIFDILLYYNRAGKLVYSNGRNEPTKELLDQIKPGNPLLQYGSANIEDPDKSVTSGVISLKEGLLLISGRPLLHADDTGPTNGTIMFAKYLTPEYKQELADTTHLDLGLYSINDSALPADAQTVKSNLSSNSIYTKVQNNQHIGGYTLFNDIYGKPAVLVRVNLQRAIYQQGKDSLRLFLILILLVGVVFTALTSLLLELVVVRRLTRLTKNVTEIKDEETLRTKLVFKGSDEVSLLARSINHMLERIKDSNKQVHGLVSQLKHEKEGVERLVKQRTHQLEDEKSRFLASINSLPLGFILTKPNDDSILMMNPSIKKILNISEENAENIAKVAGEKDSVLPKLLASAHKTAKSKKISSVELATPEGRFLHALIAPVLTRSQAVNGVVILVEDVTEARILDRSKDEFFSIASHELRTPLTAIRGNTSLIKQFYQEQLKDKELDTMVGDIYSSSVRLIDIVNDFLDASSLEQGKLKFTIADFDIKSVIAEVVQEMNGVVAEKKLYLHTQNTVDPVPHVKGDANRIKQVIYNLIGNALKFTEVGGVTIKTELAPKDMLKISVIDTGRGISPEGQQLLFHKFQQTGASLHTRDTTRGTGLGLYISKLIVETHGGHIQIDSSQEGPNHGSSFSVTLPLSKADEVIPEATPATPK